MNELVTRNIRLVYKIANKYPKHCKLPLDDRIQEGCIGLIRAAREYDESKNIPFGAFAGQHIQWAINHALRYETPVKVSTDLIPLIARIVKHELEELPVEEIASRTKESHTIVRQALAYMKTQFKALDYQMDGKDGESESFHNIVGYEEDFETKLLLDRCFSLVPDDVRKFFELSNEGYTLEEIAEMYGRTWRNIQYHMTKAKRMLQEHKQELLEV